MSKKYTFVANWKMFLDFNESINYAAKNFDAIVELSRLSNSSIVLCPTYPVLYPITKMFTSTGVQFGAQNCSAHNKGAFTGQVCAKTLHDIGCKYCIIGHSERRIYNNETDEFIAKKFDLLIDQGVSPIVCIGETLQEKQVSRTLNVLEGQLQEILELIKVERNKLNGLPVYIAYEPAWSIGTGVIPEIEYLGSIFAWIYAQIHKCAPYVHWNLLYGGSVTPENVQYFKKIDNLSGFLIGKSSTNFQEFEKIIKRIYYP